MRVGTECTNQKVRAWGPGLEGGVVGKSADFVVEAIGDDVGTLGKWSSVLHYYLAFPCSIYLYDLHPLPLTSHKSLWAAIRI